MNFYSCLPIFISIFISCTLIKDIDKKMTINEITKFVCLFMILPVLLITILCIMSQKFVNFYVPITVLTWTVLIIQVFLTQITNLVNDVIDNK